jgi:hypothetical protein
LPLPTQTDYQTALQHPTIAFGDPELQRCRVEMNNWGIPRPRSGGFALTFHLLGGSQEYAVRCFHRDVPEIRAKYDAISKNLRADTSRLFETFEYQPHGVKVSGTQYPIIKMAWVRGETLGAWVDSHSGDKAALRNLATNFRAATVQLADKGVAHGDIQHGNLIVTADGSVRFIDYDGMFVPGMTPGNGHEVGHPNYQHSQRSARHFGPLMDRFSAAAVLTALELIIADARLWDDFNNGDNLLFTRKDFEAPLASRLFSRAVALPGAGELASRLRAVALANIAQVPCVDDFLAGRGIPAVVTPPLLVRPTPAAPPVQRTGTPSNVHGGRYDVIPALDRLQLLGRVGDRVEVVGQVTEVRDKRNKAGQKYLLVDFATRPSSHFRVCVWPKAYGRLVQRVRPDELVGHRVSVLGLLERYQRYDGEFAPQVQLDDAKDAALFVDLAVAVSGGNVQPRSARTGLTNSAILDQLNGKTPVQAVAQAPSPPKKTPLRPSNAQVLAGLNQPQKTPGTPAPPPPAPRTHSAQGGASGQPASQAQAPRVSHPSPAKKDDTMPWIGAVVGGAVAGVLIPCVGIPIGAWLGWMGGVAWRDS